MFDETHWKELTSWQGPAPSLAKTWEILTAPSLPLSFTQGLLARAARSTTLQAALAQALVEGQPRLGVEASTTERLFSSPYDELKDLLGRKLRPASFDRLLKERIAKRGWNNNFANLVSGRFTELAFDASFRGALAQVGITLEDATQARSFIDYRLSANDRKASFTLSINVKNAGRQMRKAQQFFGLTPEDTIPMATYKAFGAVAGGESTLLYVYLVDWNLLERLREAYWDRISPDERQVFQLFTTFSGMTKNLEDDFISATVEERFGSLRRAVGYRDLSQLPFYAISALKCQEIFYKRHERSPYVFVRRMDTDPNVHLSVKADTIRFEQLIDQHLKTPRKRAALLESLRCIQQMTIPAPSV